MKYDHMIQGTYLSRPNRFIARVGIKNPATGQEETVVCHVRNTGRCRELLLPGVTVMLQFHPDAALSGRKTEYSLIGVWKDREGTALLINMDSQAPNQVAAEWLHTMEHTPTLPVAEGFLRDGFALRGIKREVTYGQSRFDLAFQLVTPQESANPVIRPAFMEVKGVTLEDEGVALFPDAPTERGIKHILELTEAVGAGYEAYLLFVIQMKEIREFRPNQKTHPQFGDALRLAKETGVHLLAYDCIVTEDSLKIDTPVPIWLGE